MKITLRNNVGTFDFCEMVLRKSDLWKDLSLVSKVLKLGKLPLSIYKKSKIEDKKAAVRRLYYYKEEN